MNRSLWTESIWDTSCPAWPCPICGQGVLGLVPKSVISHETVQSARSHKAEGFDFDWVEHTFTAWAECSHTSCKQKFAIAGTGGVAPQYTDDEGGFEYFDYFDPKSCFPMPDIIVLPDKCPDDIKSELRAAFALFWSNRGACAGRIRVSLELLMNHLGVPKRKKTKNSEYIDLTLHARIDSFASKDANMGAQLMALKWLGNTGSHDSQVSESDILDAFEILEHVIGEIVGGHSARVAALAKKLSKKHGGKKKK